MVLFGVKLAETAHAKVPAEKIMNKPLVILIAATMLFAGTLAQAWTPDTGNALELSVAQSIIKAKEKEPNMAKWFDSAYAFAVFPKIGKGAFIIGGAHGKGVVIHNNRTVGYTSLSQITIGAQLGGQVYSEYIMFKDKTAFDHFSRGNFQMGAQVSAVALTAGASVDANYSGGVAVFTLAEGGLMAEASIGGQKFNYTAK
jgi:lipid-binding SYLF domain-containing protein